MTKKDYIAIAKAISAVLDREISGDISSKNVSSAIANNIANVFASDNSRFDRAKFLAACGLL